MNTETTKQLRFDKSKRVMIIAMMLFAQLFLLATDAFAFGDIAINSSASHHELCISDSVTCQTNAADDGQDSNCDHCCSCHGHFTHIVLLPKSDLNYESRSESSLAAYLQHFSSHLQPGIDRPPRT
ncbi:hypothetical protein CA267_000645 [Alteromonas pelagimontana]|uniref:Uncharacterized protein n=1 Tax=Alteromonas pelagimontana TaxID=1858656 RepID=A0A6M4M9F1_9ALTE|nr:hypothetical protein [Alteromonas pelagimontana]QJR79408.1 hypothetical protein CA267_000645 [Alteromonas pelagimontana]